MNQNILTTIENLKPGDNWTEDALMYVIYKTESIDSFHTNVYTMVIREGQIVGPSVHKGTSNMGFVINRPTI